MSIKKTVATLSLILLLQACTTNRGKVIRIDPKEIRDSNADYGSEDLHLFTKSMIQSLLRSNVLGSSTPYLTLGEIHMGRGLDEHVDTGLIKNSLRNHLLKTKKVHFLDEELMKNNPQNVDYVLSGELHAIKKNTPTVIDNFYSLNLKLTNKKNALVVWSEEKEIRKIFLK